MKRVAESKRHVHRRFSYDPADVHRSTGFRVCAAVNDERTRSPLLDPLVDAIGVKQPIGAGTSLA
jgi:hypothetical protein